jgi:hypothetical protein
MCFDYANFSLFLSPILQAISIVIKKFFFKMENQKILKKMRFEDWKTKRVTSAWDSLLHSGEVKKMIEEAEDVDNDLILRILGHSLHKGKNS